MHWNRADIGSESPIEPFTTYAMTEETSEARRDFEAWLGLKEWHKQKGIPWRRGHLYKGDPGTGKTSLARALAQSAGMPIVQFDLSSMNNNEFTSGWKGMLDNVPCIALLEDIDAVFNGRKNIAMEHGLTFDCLLNTIGGVDVASGVFLIMTANNPKTLDAAIAGSGSISRPGRIDRVFEFTHSIDQAKEIVTRIIGECTPEDLRVIDGLTPAQVTEYAIDRAKRMMFNQGEAGV